MNSLPNGHPTDIQWTFSHPRTCSLAANMPILGISANRSRMLRDYPVYIFLFIRITFTPGAALELRIKAENVIKESQHNPSHDNR